MVSAVKKVDTAVIKLWGETVGAVSWLEDKDYGVFEFEPEFLKLGLDISPIIMPLERVIKGSTLYSFPEINKATYLGLPGLLADALPDKFGNRIIDAWLARQGRSAETFSPVERLSYTGQRAMGALEFLPATIGKYDKSEPVEIAELVSLSQQIMQERESLDSSIADDKKNKADAIMDILRVGTSAGGARPKAVIAMNAEGKVVSGQARAPSGFDYWILKFDGVTDLELGEPKGFGRIEYAYYLMALDAGINMSESRLLEENGRAHFITKRFDRVDGDKLHMQSLCGVAHYDFNQAGAYSYEQAFMVMRRLRLSKADAEQQYRRMLFNVVARNQDDHTKNIGFVMDKTGDWHLSPAYDMVYSHNPAGLWTNKHQMTINGRRDNFSRSDLLAVGESISLSRPEKILAEVIEVVGKWPQYAEQSDLPSKQLEEVQSGHRLVIA